METIWKKELNIHWENVDVSGRLSLPGLGQLLITTATQHAENLGFGFKELKKQNLNWVLFRMNIEIKRLPVWDEPVTLETWPQGVKSLFGLREFAMKDSEGKPLVNAGSEWMIIDLESRRPKRLNQFEDILKFENNEKAFNGTPLVPNSKGDFTNLFSIVVRHSDMDFNGHATARRYFDWMDDGLFHLHGKQEIEMIQITFFQESYLNETIILQVDENKTTVRGVKQSNGKVAFMAIVKFKE